jgi:hypothetical protein
MPIGFIKASGHKFELEQFAVASGRAAMMNRPATMNPFPECLLVLGRGGRLPQKHLIGSSIQAIGSRALRSKEEHSIKGA